MERFPKASLIEALKDCGEERIWIVYRSSKAATQGVLMNALALCQVCF